jgi:hypothetical protein
MVAWADAEKVFAKVQAWARDIELRDDHGTVLGRFVPQSVYRPGDPDWVKAITPEEIERRMAEPFMTLEEAKKWLGWK